MSTTTRKRSTLTLVLVCVALALLLVVGFGILGAVLSGNGKDAYVSGVAEIDPALGADRDRALQVGETICADLKVADAAALAPLVVQRMAGMAEIDEAQAAELIGLAEKHLCA